MKVPMIDLQAQMAPIRGELDDAVRAIFDDAAFILGAGVARFESAFASYVGRAFCVGVNSGTSALHLALLAAGVGPGDEVVTTPYTWISTAWAVTYCGARPVFADVDARTGQLDPLRAEAAITPRTKAILPVDLYGHLADLGAFEEIAARHGLALIEDAAQSQGARLRGRPAGSFGLLSCFSFYPSKNLGAAGEAGAVVTDDAALAERIRRLRDHAQEGRHNHVEVGYNYRMEGLQGAVLAVKLRHLDRWNEARRQHAARYDALLADIPDVVAPVVRAGAEPVWHLYPVRVPDRDRVHADLQAREISAAVHYPVPVHLQPAYASQGWIRGACPAAEALARDSLSLPIFPEMTSEQLAFVVTSLADSLRAG